MLFIFQYLQLPSIHIQASAEVKNIIKRCHATLVMYSKCSYTAPYTALFPAYQPYLSTIGSFYNSLQYWVTEMIDVVVLNSVCMIMLKYVNQPLFIVLFVVFQVNCLLYMSSPNYLAITFLLVIPNYFSL
jgi:hypothetical protein